MNVRCSKCGRGVYHDMTAGKGYGSSSFPLRDDVDESTFCPKGDRHVGEIVHD